MALWGPENLLHNQYLLCVNGKIVCKKAEKNTVTCISSFSIHYILLSTDPQVILTSDLVRSGGLPDTLFNIQALMYEKH